MRGPLNREDIVGLFHELSEKLRARGVRGHVYIVGGAAMILGFRRDRTTHDVDARIEADKEAVTEAAADVAQVHDLPQNWLNENATLFMPHARDTQARTVFDTPNLVVTGASPQHLLAMKLDAARDTDQQDIRTLLETLQIQAREEAIDIHQRIFPHTPLGQAGREILDRSLAEIARQRTREPPPEESALDDGSGTVDPPADAAGP